MYNYILTNGLYLERLQERPLVETTNRWVIGPYHGTDGGYIKKRKIPVTWLEYQFNLWFVWGWLDDDANEDTFAYGHCFNEEHLDSISHKLFCKKWMVGEKPFYGNTFDLGDRRGDYPSFKFFPALVWNTRNTAYNFKYYLYEMSEAEWNKTKPFFKIIKGHAFGWIPFSDEVKSEGRKGRLVFMEPISNIF